MVFQFALSPTPTALQSDALGPGSGLWLARVALDV